MDLASVLDQWGFRHLADVFVAADIDIDALKLLDETTARSLMTPGVFLKFWPVYCAHKPNFDVSFTSTADGNSSRPQPPAEKKRIVFEDDILREDNNEESDDEDDSSSNSPQQIEQHTQLVKDLRDLFNLSFIGETLLEKTDELTDSDRNRIAEIVVCEELRRTKPIGHIPRSKFIRFSKAIADLFPDEDKETYYIPYHKVHNVVFVAQGKLNNQYNHWRGVGVSTNILQSLRSKSKNGSGRSSVTLSADDKVSVKWLSVNLGPQQLVEQHWSSTYSHRMAILDVSRNPAVTVSEYYSRFPALRQPWAYSLLLQDFATAYPEKVNKLNENWNSFSVRLLDKLKKVKNLDRKVIEKLTKFQDEDHGVSVCHHFLENFSLLFPSQVVVRGRKPNNWTANLNEMQKGFLLHVVTEAELMDFIGKKVARLKSFKKPLSFHPFPALVGLDLHNIDKCLVVIQPKEIYQVSSPAEAIDVTFKAIIALCCEYPPESKFMWLVIQKSLYGINTVWDKASPPIVPILKFFSK